MSRGAPAARAAGLLALACACTSGRDAEPQAPAPQPQADAAAQPDEYRDKARSEIHAGNVDSELEKLKRELGGS